MLKTREILKVVYLPRKQIGQTKSWNTSFNPNLRRKDFLYYKTDFFRIQLSIFFIMKN